MFAHVKLILLQLNPHYLDLGYPKLSIIRASLTVPIPDQVLIILSIIWTIDYLDILAWSGVSGLGLTVDVDTYKVSLIETYPLLR